MPAQETKSYPSDWKHWMELSEQQRRYAIFDKEFWPSLNPDQQQNFLDTSDWQELRHVEPARQTKLDGLLSLDQVSQHLGLTTVQVYWLMSTRKLPGWLVGGVWKFDRRQIDRWAEAMGGKDSARRDVEAQIAKHRAAQNAPAAH